MDQYVGVIIAIMTAVGGWFALRNKADGQVVTDLKEYANRLEVRLNYVEGEVMKCHVERDTLAREAATLRGQLLSANILPCVDPK